MDSLNFYNIRVEKANAIQRHRQLQKIANLCLIIEVCVVLVLISRLSMQLPLAFKNSGGYFRDVTVTLASPRFVFVVGNVIVITLFVKSGRFSARDSTAKTSAFDLYEEFIKKSEKIQRVHSDETRRLEDRNTSYASKVKDYRSVQSYLQSSYSGFGEKSLSAPHRLKPEKLERPSSYSFEKLTTGSDTGDEVGHEEFQRRVEAFIARQQRLRREEQ